MFMGFLKLSTQVTITVVVVSSTDHLSGKTGLAAGLTIYLTKAGAAPAAITPTTTEIDSANMPGSYSLVFTTTHTNTLGEFHIYVTGSGADAADYYWQVSTYLPGEAATLQTDQAVNTTKVGGTTQTARDLGAQLDATVSSRLASTALVTASGTASAGAAGSITLAGASATDSLYVGQVVVITGGTGAGQARVITAYVGSTKVATVDRNWQTNPDNTSVFIVLALDAPKTDSSLNVTSNSGGGTFVANLTQVNGHAVTDTTSGVLDVNAQRLGGTSQTGRDLGASVLLSSGTGTGQLDFTSGVVKANLVQILATALTETAGQIAAAFKKFFDKASPTGTINSIPDVVPGGNGGLPTTDANNAVKVQSGTSANQISLSSGLVALSNAGIDAILDRRTIGLKKNTSFTGLPFLMLDTSGNPAPGKTVTAQVRLDASTTYGAGSLAVTEVANGEYLLAGAAADVNAIFGTFKMTASGCKATFERFITIP